MTRPATRVAVLISGEGSNLQALIDAARAAQLGAEIVAVVSNRGAARGLERARAAGITALASAAVRGQDARRLRRGAGRTARSARARSARARGLHADLGPRFVERFAGRMLNIHPSLLPKYPGLDTHRRVLEAGETLGTAPPCTSSRPSSTRARRSFSTGSASAPATRRNPSRSASMSASTSSCPAPCLGSRPAA